MSFKLLIPWSNAIEMTQNRAMNDQNGSMASSNRNSDLKTRDELSFDGLNPQAVQIGFGVFGIKLDPIKEFLDTARGG